MLLHSRKGDNRVIQHTEQLEAYVIVTGTICVNGQIDITIMHKYHRNIDQQANCAFESSVWALVLIILTALRSDATLWASAVQRNAIWFA